MVAAGLLAGLLFSVVGPAVLPGVGARMGAVAFLAGSVVYLLAEITGNDAPSILPADATGFGNWAMVPIGMAGALVTWALTHGRAMPFVLASGLTSLAVCGVVALTVPHGASLAAAWFGGTFVGGVGTGRLPNAGWVGLAGLVFGLLTLHFSGPLAGHVGVLGATATIACLAVGALEWVVLAPPVQRRVARVIGRRHARRAMV